MCVIFFDKQACKTQFNLMSMVANHLTFSRSNKNKRISFQQLLLGMLNNKCRHFSYSPTHIPNKTNKNIISVAQWNSA